MLFPSDWTVVRAPKTKGAAGIRYTLHAALRKQDFKARQNFLAHFRNHGRFLSSTSAQNPHLPTCDGTAKSRDFASPPNRRSRLCHSKFWPQGRQPERDQLIMRGSNQCILRVTAQKPRHFLWPRGAERSFATHACRSPSLFLRGLVVFLRPAPRFAWRSFLT